MKTFVSVLSMAFLSSVAFSADVDYKHCMGAVNELAKVTDNFMQMDSAGKIKVKDTSSMKTDGEAEIYTDFVITYPSDKKESKSKKDDTALTDVESLRVRYEKAENGKPSGKIIGIDYTVKDKKYSHGGQLSMDFNYKNGHCVPNTTKKSVFGQKGKAGSFLINTLAKVVPTTRAWDLVKCKRLHDYVELNKKLEICLSSAAELEKLESVMNDLVDGKPLSLSKHEKSIKDKQSNIDKAFATYSVAKIYMEGCDESGYKDILSDKQYWDAISAAPVEVSAEEKATIVK